MFQGRFIMTLEFEHNAHINICKKKTDIKYTYILLSVCP